MSRRCRAALRPLGFYLRCSGESGSVAYLLWDESGACQLVATCLETAGGAPLGTLELVVRVRHTALTHLYIQMCAPSLFVSSGSGHSQPPEALSLFFPPSCPGSVFNSVSNACFVGRESWVCLAATTLHPAPRLVHNRLQSTKGR